MNERENHQTREEDGKSESRTGRDSLELRYEVNKSITLSNHLPEGLSERFSSLTDDDSARILYTPNVVEICRGGADGLTTTIDLETYIAKFVDHAAEEYANIPIKDLFEEDQRDDTTIKSTGIRRMEEYGNRTAEVERFDVTRNELVLELWTLQKSPRVPALSRILWGLLLPGAPPEVYQLGIPAEIKARLTDNSDQLLHIRLVDWREGVADEPSLVPPDSYTEREQFSKTSRVAADSELRSQFSAPHQLTLSRLNHRSEESTGRTDDNSIFDHQQAMRVLHALRRSGQDFAWITDQSSMDTVAASINEITAPLDQFYGDGAGGDAPMHVIIDWFSQLRPHLEFRAEEGDDMTDDLLEVIATLLFMLKVAQLEPGFSDEELPPEFTEAEIDRFREVLRIAREDPDDFEARGLNIEARRVMYFLDDEFFRVLRRRRLADEYFASLGEHRLELGPRRINGDPDDFMFWRAWDFDTTIDLGSGPLIPEARFREDCIDFRIQLSEIDIDCQFTTRLGSHWAATLCAFFTFGACVAATTTYGYATISWEDLSFLFQVRPRLEDGEVHLGVEFDESGSAIGDADVLLIGANPVSSSAALTISGMITAVMDNLLINKLLDIVGKTEDFLDDGASVWPEIWHAISGPSGGIATAALFDEGAGVFEGVLRGGFRRGLPPGFARDVDTASTESFEYGFSDRYLTAWLRELLPLDGTDETLLPTEPLLERFGVALPDPEELPGADEPADLGRVTSFTPPGIGCDTPPMAPAPEFENRTRLLRRAPVVQLPETSPSEIAGKVVLTYDVTITAVRRDYIPRPIPVREQVPEESPGPFDPGFAFGENTGLFNLSRYGQFNRRLALQLLGRSHPGGPFDGPIESRGDSSPPFPDGGNPFGGDPFRGVPRGGRGYVPTYCEWIFDEAERELTRYLNATVRVTADIRIGFDENGRSIWLPELMLSITGTTDDGPELDTQVTRLEVSDPLTELDEDDLETYLVDVGRDDAGALLRSALNPRALSRTRNLLPDGQVVDLVFNVAFADRATPNRIEDDIQTFLTELVTWEQSGDVDGFQYEVRDGLLYWPVGLTENLTQLIE